MNEIRKKIRSLFSGLLRVAVQTPRVMLYQLLSNNRPIGSPKCYQPLQTIGSGTIEFGVDVKLGMFPSPYFFSTYIYLEARNSSASITIGAGTWVNNNFCAIAEHTSITIGNNCLIGAGVEILDSDFHGTRVEDRSKSRPEWAKSVRVGDNVFIGSNVKILKGVSIGDGSAIAYGSIVTKDIPSGVIAGGSPAKVLKAIA